MLVLVVVVAVVSAVVSWVASGRIKSPAEIAAETDPPPPSLITVAVEQRVLSQNVVVRGTVRASDTTEISPASTDGTPIVTAMPKEAGDQIVEGDVLIGVAGRPIIALQGELPAFRNMIPTLEGPDVQQLEAALARLGYDPGDIDGVYSTATSDAVTELYRDAGYQTAESEGGEEEAVDAAEEAIQAQEQAVAEAEDALAEARKAIPESERLQLDQAVTRAENQVETAKTTAEAEKAAAAQTITDAESGLAAATQRLQQAQNGAHPDSGEPPTAEELAALEAAQSAAQGALDAAKADQSRVATQQDNLIAEAESELELQKALREEGLQTAETTPLQERLDDAEEALDEAEADLVEAQAKVGAHVPVGEIVFLQSFPREVQSLNVELGDSPAGALMTVSGPETLIDSGLSSADRQLVEVGSEALLEDDGLGLSVPAVVSFVAENPGGPDLADDRYAMQLEPPGDLPEEALNVNMRISIPISTTGGEVLAVPFAALSASSDGSARVEVERSAGLTELVTVATGLRAEGMVEIEPLDGALVAGDRVVVGRDLQLPGSTDAEAEDTDDDAEEGTT